MLDLLEVPFEEGFQIQVNVIEGLGLREETQLLGVIRQGRARHIFNQIVQVIIHGPLVVPSVLKLPRGC